jgi:hypothetical protein
VRAATRIAALFTMVSDAASLICSSVIIRGASLRLSWGHGLLLEAWLPVLLGPRAERPSS